MRLPCISAAISNHSTSQCHLPPTRQSTGRRIGGVRFSFGPLRGAGYLVGQLVDEPAKAIAGVAMGNVSVANLLHSWGWRVLRVDPGHQRYAANRRIRFPLGRRV